MENSSEPNCFDEIKKEAKKLLDFHMVSNGLVPELTPDEKVAVDVGMSCGIHAAMEYYIKTHDRR